jgi:hypothetical protein
MDTHSSSAAIGGASAESAFPDFLSDHSPLPATVVVK